MNIFHTFSQRFYCWLWTSKYQLGLLLLCAFSPLTTIFSENFNYQEFCVTIPPGLPEYRRESQPLNFRPILVGIKLPTTLSQQISTNDEPYFGRMSAIELSWKLFFMNLYFCNSLFVAYGWMDIRLFILFPQHQVKYGILFC